MYFHDASCLIFYVKALNRQTVNLAQGNSQRNSAGAGIIDAVTLTFFIQLGLGETAETHSQVGLRKDILNPLCLTW